MNLVEKFDFGNSSVYMDPQYKKVERLYITSRYMWMNELYNRWRDAELPTPFKDFVFEEKGEFRMGAPKGRYQIKLIFFDPHQGWGPFQVQVGSTSAKSPIFTGNTYETIQIDVPKNVVTERVLEFEHEGGPLAVRFSGLDGGMFMVNGLELWSESPCQLEEMFVEAPRDQLPSVAEVMKVGPADPLIALDRACVWLCAHRKEDGFLGDLENEKKLWYTASYPIRTLLAGYAVSGKAEYRKVATEILDQLVEEQMPEGAFTQACRGKKTKDCSEQELEEIRKHNWMNLADVGSMAAALTTACAYVDPEREARYQKAVDRYLNDWAFRFRQENGGFTNGWVLKPADKVYSVSTAATALTAGLYSRLTGDTSYLRVAEDAVLLLAKDWNEDGRNWNWIYDGTIPGHDHYQDTTEFGDVFYTMEALSAILALSDRQSVRQTVFDAIRRYLFGSEGLLAKLGANSWWRLQNNWHNSKSAGNPIVLLDFLLYGGEFGASQEELERVQKAYDLCSRYLCSESLSQQIGVMAEDPEGPLPFRPHSIQSWTGCAVAATGFAGIAYAHMARPGIIYLQ